MNNRPTNRPTQHVGYIGLNRNISDSSREQVQTRSLTIKGFKGYLGGDRTDWENRYYIRLAVKEGFEPSIRY